MPPSDRRLGVPDIRGRKNGPPIVSLTAYATTIARLLDPHCDMLLVGDSLGMVVYGLPTTLPVTLDMMIAHGAAVVRGSRHACILVDLPFGAYQESPEQAFRAAARILQETGAAAVKLEGGTTMAPTVRFLVERGVPVCGHIGLMPQAVNIAGGFRSTGRTDEDAARVRDDAHAIAAAGAFAVVLEGIVEPLAASITRALDIPTIGIGASPECDGQILVSDDLLGLFDAFTPRFVKRYAELGNLVGQAAASYAADVTARRFPGPEHCFGALPQTPPGTGPLDRPGSGQVVSEN